MDFLTLWLIKILKSCHLQALPPKLLHISQLKRWHQCRYQSHTGQKNQAIIFPFCSNSIGCPLVTGLNLKYWLLHAKTFVNLNSNICKTASPPVLCHNSLAHQNSAFCGCHANLQMEKIHCPVHTSALSVVTPHFMECLTRGGQEVSRFPGLLQIMYNWIIQWGFLSM